MLPPPNGSSVCYHLYALQFNDGDKALQNFPKLWNAKSTAKSIISLFTGNRYKTSIITPRKMTNAEKYYAQCLSFAIIPRLSDDEVDYGVIESVIDASIMTQRLILGTAQLGMTTALPTAAVSHKRQAREIIKTAWGRGAITRFDTAQDYGESEGLLGTLLEELGIVNEAKNHDQAKPA